MDTNYLRKDIIKYVFIATTVIVISILAFTVTVEIHLSNKIDRLEEAIKAEGAIFVNKDRDEIDQNLKNGIFKAITDLNIERPDIVLSQAIVESAGFKSALFKEHNNIFGMKAAKSRPYTYTGITESVYAHYDSWLDSVKDYAIRQAAYARGLSRDQYYKLLGKIYAEDDIYIKTVQLNNDYIE
jgi:uncharacterized FlgJ-related protein